MLEFISRCFVRTKDGEAETGHQEEPSADEKGKPPNRRDILLEPLDDEPWAWIKAVSDILNSFDKNCNCDPEPVEMAPYLYLSSEAGIRNGLVLGKWNVPINHVLTTNGMSSQQKESLQQAVMLDGNKSNGEDEKRGCCRRHHLFISGQDEEGYDMIGNHWEMCYEFLKPVKDEYDEMEEQTSSKAVVHCVAGMNRSALIVASALLVLERKPLLEVVKHMKAKRGVVLTNRSFQRQLCNLAAKEGLLGDKPEGYDDDPVLHWYNVQRPKASSALDRMTF